MLFKNVIGQIDVKLHLVNMVQQNRISHALLFLGKEGSGALPMAIAFAQYIVCEKVNRKGGTETAGLSLFGEETPPPPGEAGRGSRIPKIFSIRIHFSLGFAQGRAC